MDRRIGRLGAAVAVFALSALVVVLAGLGASPRAWAAGHTYTSPGYDSTETVPTKLSTPPPPAKLIKLGDGADPRVLVDAAGTGQIAYASLPDDAESQVRDCVLMRGQSGRAANTTFGPTATSPEYSIDDDGPSPLAIGNELVMLDHRYPDDETLPDGTTGSPTYLWTSDDGGRTFTGPGITGNLPVSGNAVVWGGGNPQIAWITDTQTGGTFFQSASAGAYSGAQLNLGDSGPDQATAGRLAVDGTLPIAEFQDLNHHIFIRKYSGSGSVDDSANWSRAEVDGYGYSQIVAGPSGVFLLYQRVSDQALVVQKIVDGQPVGGPVKILSDLDYAHSNYAINEDSGGQLTVAFISGDESNKVSVTTSANGTSWSTPQLIASGVTGPSHLSVGAAGDGGGFVAFQVPEPGGTSQYAIDVAEFGTLQATGLPGLGNLDGSGAGSLGGDPNATSSCGDIHFGDIDAITQNGSCFLRDRSDPTSDAKVAQGEIRLNGLQIIPDAGASIVIDPKQHLIKSSGQVSVVLRAPGIGDVTLFHGALSLQLSGDLADVGQQLFDFDVSQATSSLFGFGFEGKIDVQIAKDGSVQIPVSLKLPEYMGGVSAQALLKADNADGLELESLHISVDDLELGALEVKGLDITYTKSSEQWTGHATLYVPGGSPYFKIYADVEFDHGDFTMGSFDAGFGFPGIPIYTDTYFTGFSGGFDIHPDKRVFYGSADFGAIPTGDEYGIGVNGAVKVTFYNNGPVKVDVTGTGTVEGEQIASGELIFQTDGVFVVTGNVDINAADVAEFTASINANVDLPSKEFSASLTGELKVFKLDLFSAGGVISSKGAGACVSYGPLYAGFTYTWGGSADPILGTSCDFSQFVLAPVDLQPDAVTGHAAPGSSVTIAPRTDSTDIVVTGSGGPPSVVLVDPRGQTVVPAALGAEDGTAPAVAAQNPDSSQTVVLLRSPRAGRWQVEPAAGSPAITQIASARGFPKPKITTSVSGTAAHRVLHYRSNVGQGLTTTFSEHSGGAYQTIGTTARPHGTLAFTPATGPAGRRQIVAVISAGGLPRERIVVGHYRAPAPARPGAVGGLKVSEHGTAFHVRFGTAAGASHYVVHAIGDDGRHLTRVISHGPHRFSLPAIGYANTLTVTVAGVSAYGKTGPATRAAASYTSTVLRRVQAARKRGAHRSRHASGRKHTHTHRRKK